MATRIIDEGKPTGKTLGELTGRVVTIDGIKYLCLGQVSAIDAEVIPFDWSHRLMIRHTVTVSEKILPHNIPIDLDIHIVGMLAISSLHPRRTHPVLGCDFQGAVVEVSLH